MKRLIKNKLLSNNFILPFKSGYRFIFIFHDISNPDSHHYSPLYSTTVAHFEEQISFLRNNFELIDLDKITQEEPFKNNVASIMFDDGFKSVETIAFPYLQKQNIPFSVFLNKNAIKNNRLWLSDLTLNKERFIENYHLKHLAYSDVNYKHLINDAAFHNHVPNLNLTSDASQNQIYLNESDILKLSKAGVIMGNHGSFHINLGLATINNLEEEIVSNKKFIENIIQTPLKHYAFAFGKKEHYTKQVIEAIKNSGHEFLYTSNPSGFAANFNKQLIPRIGLINQSPEQIMFYINRQFVKKINI